MIRLVVHGAAGRMGARVRALAEADPGFEVVATVDHRGDVPDLAPGIADVVIDFSSPEGAVTAARLAVGMGAGLLVGTTGLSGEIAGVLGDSGRSIPVLVAPNTSLGVAVLAHLAVEAARLLGGRYDIDIIDVHHAAKRDAPSGTALRLAAVMRDRAAAPVPPERVHCVRSGEVVGDHTVSFAGPGERLTITHAAGSRDLFAAGALRAAAWLAGRPAGQYDMEDALGLTRPALQDVTR